MLYNGNKMIEISVNLMFSVSMIEIIIKIVSILSYIFIRFVMIKFFVCFILLIIWEMIFFVFVFV